MAIIGPESLQLSWIGPYDQFLCKECEAKFMVSDQHGVEFIRRLDAGRPIYSPQTGEVSGRTYGADLVDPAKLRFFGLSLLLRAHLARTPWWSSVDLGPFYERLAALVRTGDTGGPDEFGMVLERPWGILSSTAASPTRERWFGVNAYCFRLPGLKVYMIVDSRPITPSLRELQVSIGRDVMIPVRKTRDEEVGLALGRATQHAERIARLARRHRDP